jgi:hypothetical protein
MFIAYACRTERSHRQDFRFRETFCLYSNQMLVACCSFAVKGFWALWNIYECLCFYNRCHANPVNEFGVMSSVCMLVGW